MTAHELTELIDRVVEEPGLWERIQRARELRLKVLRECASSLTNSLQTPEQSTATERITTTPNEDT